MSGPKVVRIVTREEAVAICEQRLREAEHALAAWQTSVAALGQADAASAAATQSRLEQLRELLVQERFLDLQDAVKYELGFLKADLAEREQRAVDAAAATHAQQRQRQDNRRVLLAALGSLEGPVAAGLAERLHAAGEDTLDSVLAEGYAWLGGQSAGNAAQASLSEAQRELAQTLGSDEQRVDFATWRAAQAPAQRDPRLLRIDRHIAELSVLAGSELAATFQQRLSRIEQESDFGRCGMLLDSLQLELAETCRHDANLREQLAVLRRLLAEAMRSVGAEEAAQLGAAVEHAAAARDLDGIAALTRRCQTLIDEALAQQAAGARRQAVLQALSGLGYEVHEGMATAWARDGRLALRKSATPGYGVEVGGQAAQGRLQMRAVAFDGQHDRRRDLDIETRWCADFQQLQAALQHAGGELRVERALAVGEVALKQLGTEPGANRPARSTPAKQRTRSDAK